MKLAIVIIVGLILAVIAAQVALSLQFARRIAAAEAELQGTPLSAPRDDLPAPIAAFARRGMAGADIAGASLTLTQICSMRLSKGSDWQDMSARQVIAASQPGFAWSARISAGPLTLVRVIDSYVGGRGLLEVRAAGAVRIGRSVGPLADRGEAMRYLAELPWFPDAILTNRAVRWVVLEDGRVSATLDLADGPATVIFGLDEAGDIVTMQATGRPSEDEEGRPDDKLWRGRFWDYGEIGGRRIARAGEVGWVWPDGYESYWRGRITGYSVAARMAN